MSKPIIRIRQKKSMNKHILQIPPLLSRGDYSNSRKMDAFIHPSCARFQLSANRNIGE